MDSVNISDDRNQTALQEQDAWRTLMNKDSMPRSASSGKNRTKLHDVGCHIIHYACCEAGLRSQREVIVPMLASERMTEPRVGRGRLGTPGLPHIRLDYTVVDAEALHYSSVMRKAQEKAPAAAQAERTKASKYGNAKGRNRSYRNRDAAPWSIRS